MKIVIAPQAFKGTLSAGRAAEAMVEAALAVYPHADVVRCPVADGGDGTLDALIEATGGAYHNVETTGPMGEPVVARWGSLGDGHTAVVETAQACGLALLPSNVRDPLNSSDNVRRWRHHPSSAGRRVPSHHPWHRRQRHQRRWRGAGDVPRRPALAGERQCDCRSGARACWGSPALTPPSWTRDWARSGAGHRHGRHQRSLRADRRIGHLRPAEGRVAGRRGAA